MILETQEDTPGLPGPSSSSSSPELQTYLCAGCSDKILDRYYLMAVDKHWHLECLRCSDCGQILESQQSCFIRNDAIFCREDYYKRFANQECAGCRTIILPSELVMRTKTAVYHVSCFVCSTCQAILSPGDQYGLRDGVIYCQDHFEPNLLPLIMGQSSVPQQENLDFFGARSMKGRRKKRQLHDQIPENTMCPTMNYLSGELTDLVANSNVFSPGQSARQKRVRTSFKHHQLKAMKMYFSYNHNPDAKDLKQLAQKTGLSKRVLQVWFQNARAKFRRQDMRESDVIKDIRTSKPSTSDSEEQKLDDSSFTPSPIPFPPQQTMDFGSDYHPQDMDYQGSEQVMVGMQHSLLTPPDSGMDRVKSDDSYEELFQMVGQ